jgi:hypothetical protein
MPLAASTRLRIAKVHYLVGEWYWRSRLRDKILSVRARSRTQRLDFANRRFVIFLVPGRDLINGGILSIFSIASETRKLLVDRGVTVAICTAQSEPRILKYTKFENDAEILALSDVMCCLPNGSDVLVHIPELFTKQYGTECLSTYRKRVDLKWRFNILLQNIDLLPQRDDIEALKTVGTVTATTAHRAYATEATAQRIGCRVNFLSTFASPEQYERIGYPRKQKLIMISPDYHPDKERILREICNALPDHQMIEIRNIPYSKFRQIAKDAKFTFTFGEGLDGYFIETIFSGGVAMAIFNDRFFTDEYRTLDGVFPDSETALLKVAEFAKMADSEMRYQAISNRQYEIAARNYSRKEYLDNIKKFYDENFLSVVS